MEPVDLEKLRIMRDDEHNRLRCLDIISNSETTKAASLSIEQIIAEADKLFKYVKNGIAE